MPPSWRSPLAIAIRATLLACFSAPFVADWPKSPACAHQGKTDKMSHNDFRSTKTVLIACENDQELRDLAEVVSALRQTYSFQVIWFKSWDLFLDHKRRSAHNYPFIGAEDAVVRPIALVARGFHQLSIQMKAALGLLNAVRLAQVLLARKVDICLTGKALVFTRLSSLLCRKTTYVAYIRSLLVNDGKRRSTSDAVMAAVAPFLPQGLMAMLRPYACHQCYTVGTVTKDALVGMGLASSTVTVVGPISGDRCVDEEDNPGRVQPADGFREIVFLTQAFSWHNDSAAHQQQSVLLESLIQEVKSTSVAHDLGLRIRVHPRDDRSIYEHLLDSTVSLDDTGAIPPEPNPRFTCGFDRVDPGI